MLGTTIAGVVASVATSITMSTAIITTDSAVLRAAPREAAQQQATLRQGEMVEVRGERLDYLQVWDHQRERGGFVRASQVRRTGLSAAEAPELLTVLRFVKDNSGQEALGIGLAAAWLQAAPKAVVQSTAGVEVLDALGTLADRLASRASGGAAGGASDALSSSGQAISKAQEANVAAHLEVAARYGLRFASYEHSGRMQVCYEGEAFRRVMAMQATPDQRARAALGLTRSECTDPNLRSNERMALQEWRADVLDKAIDSPAPTMADRAPPVAHSRLSNVAQVLSPTAALPGYLKNRLLMRRASVNSTLAYQLTRFGHLAQSVKAVATAERALNDLAAINKLELPDEDQASYNDTVMRVNASRWAAVAVAADLPSKQPSVITRVGQAGETCVLLIDAQHDSANPLLKRCTFGQVWAQSAALNREANALVLAVQPMPTWRELWVFRKQADVWTVSVLPPANTTPDMGYAEFAGWVPGGKHMLVAREARGEGKYLRNYAVVNLDTLAPERQASDASALGAFTRWQDAAWKQASPSLR